MIRIDEIYCNIFLPRVQARPLQDMHWFDPFGSVKFTDINSLPKVPWGARSGARELANMRDPMARHFLFWDQEPLHPETAVVTLPLFCDRYVGQRHLITSERDSDAVTDACATYGFQPHYYFFHGWAALDWYRGYDRSFLMPPPQERKITHTFLMPNRIVAGRRRHRLILMYNLIRLGLVHGSNHISFPAVCPGEMIPVSDAVRSLDHIYHDVGSVFASQSLPLDFEGEKDHPMKSCWLDLFDQGSHSLLYLITETVAQGRRQHLTEKTFKPICMRMPFVLAGTQHSLRYLRSYGFRTFGDIWDESYDNEPNEVLRMERIANLLRSLDELPGAAKQELFLACHDVVEHNYRHFYQGTFEQMLWQELLSMLEGMGV